MTFITGFLIGLVLGRLVFWLIDVLIAAYIVGKAVKEHEANGK